jgi:PAS domain S-box-containing protein
MSNDPVILFYTSNDQELSGRMAALVKERGVPVQVKVITSSSALYNALAEGNVALLVVFPAAPEISLKNKEVNLPPVLLVGDTGLSENDLPEDIAVSRIEPGQEHDFLFMLSLLNGQPVNRSHYDEPDAGLWKKIIKSAEEYIVVTQGDYLVFFNDRIPEIFQADPEYIRSHPYWEFVHPDDFSLLREMREKRLKGNMDRVPYRFRIRSRKGEDVWVENIGYSIRWQGEPATLNFLVPIGEQIKAEKKVQRTEEFLQDIIEFSPLGLAILDDEMRFVQVNRSLCERTGMTVQKLEGKKIKDIPIFRESGIIEKLYLEKKGEEYNGLGAEVSLECSDETVRDCLVSRYYSMINNRTILWFTEVTEKNHMVDDLRQSERKYRNLMENMHEGTLAIDEDGKILESNYSLRKLLGYSDDEMSSKSYWDLTPSFWQPLEKKIIEELLEENREKKYEKEFLKKDGDLIITEVHISLREETVNDKKCIWMFVRDITQEKNNEKEILERELKYRTILEYSPLPLMSEDFSALREQIMQLGDLGVEDIQKYLNKHPEVVKEMLRKVRPLEASQKALEFFEVSSTNEIAEMYKNQELSDDLVTALTRLVIDFLKGDNIFEGEITSLTKNGKKKNVIIRWVLVPGHELSWDMVLVAISDLTERLAYQEQLQVLSSAVNNSPASVVITNPQGDIEYVNPKFSEVTGYSAEEAIGQNPRILKSGNLPDSFYKDLWQTISRGEVWRGEFENKKKNGEIFWELASITGIKNEKGEIAYYVAIKEDITERKNTELELLRAKEKAEESDRLKTAFLANMSHEIRTPLNAIIGFTEMLRTDTLEPELREEYFAIINQSSQALLKLIDDIIDVAKIEAGHIRIIPHKVDITGLLNELYTIIQRDLSVNGKDVVARLTVPWDKEFMISIDSFRLKQVMLNILNNAVKFTDQGEIEFGYRLKGKDTIEFFVRDTGIGIPADQHKVIFERFRQADGSSTRKYGGTGLGLWVSRNLVELMGGTIRVLSEPGRGATFLVKLPLDKDAEIPEHVPEQPADKQTIADWRNKKILIAEDNDSNYEYLKAVLSVKKAMLVRAYDGKEALDLLRDHEDVDLVLMDIQMPVLNGYEATRLIKKFKPDLPVIAQTAYAMSEDRERIIRAGCDEYIAKPIQPRKLLSLLEKFLIREKPL